MSADEATNQQLDATPKMPGESKCIQLLGSTRVCRVGAVLGSSLVNNAEARAARVHCCRRGHCCRRARARARALVRARAARGPRRDPDAAPAAPPRAPQLPEHGVLNMLRNRGLADPGDVFVIQFGLWHMLEGPPGFEKFKAAVQQLGEDYQARRRARPGGGVGRRNGAQRARPPPRRRAPNARAPPPPAPRARARSAPRAAGRTSSSATHQ